MTKVKIKKTKSKIKPSGKKAAISILSDGSLGNFIKTLRINSEQEKLLIDELPQMDVKERMELLETLTDVYALNQEEAKAIKKLKDNWE